VLKDLAESPAMFLGEMNRLLYDNTESHFLTAAYMVVDSARQSITYAQAGHIPLIINNRQGHQIREYKPKGSLMGIKTTLNSEEIQIPLHQGDRIILYTDGITELWDQSNQEMFGEKSFYEFIYASEGVNHLNFAANLENKLNEWHGEGSYDDDITYVVIDHG
jgi:serine phosphatase RsbU (regulator of sigma subunit)